MSVAERRQPSGEAKTLLKGIAILNAIAEQPEGLTLADVTRTADVTKATAHRLLASLQDAGLVRPLGQGRYGLGSHCLVLGEAFLAALDLRQESLQALRELVEVTGETVHLGILTGEQIVYIEKLDSPHAVRMYSRVGATNPATTTSLGKAILAFSPASVLDAVYASPIPRRTANTVTDPEEARRHLEQVRERGFSIDDVENEEGIRCVAAPILDHHGVAVGGISISGPEQRVTSERIPELGAAVRSAGEQVSRRIGLRGPYPPPAPAS